MRHDLETAPCDHPTAHHRPIEPHTDPAISSLPVIPGRTSLCHFYPGYLELLVAHVISVFYAQPPTFCYPALELVKAVYTVPLLYPAFSTVKGEVEAPYIP